MSRFRMRARGISTKVLYALAPVAVFAFCVVPMVLKGAADDVEDSTGPQRQHPPHGTHFWFEVIESFNAKYEGDTPGHIGRGGGIKFHPHVALGDSVYHRIGEEDRVIGVVTGAIWDRLKGSLTVEFRPQEDHRIAVGDDVWVDLNPAPRVKETRYSDETPKETK